MSGGGLSMAFGMLMHMPWYHYVIMAVVVVALGVLVHRRIRRRYWPQHATVGGTDFAEYAAILLGVEFGAMVVVVVGVGVSGGMLAYHMA